MKDIRTAAQELIDRHGDVAVDIARDRAKQLELAADWPAHTVALLVLNEIERMSATSANEQGGEAAAKMDPPRMESG